MKLRIQFSKHGVMKFIGHLDLMRYFQKALRRAEIDIAYSGGFSPHPILSFAAPLGVGLESDGEYLDLEVNSKTTSQEMKERLNGVMAEGITALRIVALPEQAKNAMASVAAAGYLVRFRSGYEPDFDLKKAVDAVNEAKSLPFRKETKKGEQLLDLRPSIYELIFREDKERGRKAVFMLVNASSAGNIKPAMVMQAVYAVFGKNLPDFALEITRTDTFLNAGDPKEPRWFPLWTAGEEF